MTRLKTKSTHGGIVGKAKTKQGTSLGQNIYKVHNKNTLWRLTTTCHTAFRLSPKVFDFVSVHLQVSDDHLRATTVEWFASSSPWNTNLPHPCHDKAEESSPILVVGWLMQLSRLAPAVTCSHGRSKYNESRILEDLSIEKLPRTRYPNALARVVESHEQQGPMCPMSESFTSSWHTTSNIVFTDSKVANTNRARKLLDAVC